MILWISALLLVTGVGVALRVWLRARHRRLIARRRRVEQPNSYYSAPGVRRLVDLERWGRIQLDQLHPVNREEVLRLLQLVRGTGSDALDPKERQFLDNMARLGRAKPRSSENLAAPQPRERGGSQETLVPHSPTPASASGRGSADRSRS